MKNSRESNKKTKNIYRRRRIGAALATAALVGAAVEAGPAVLGHAARVAGISSPHYLADNGDATARLATLGNGPGEFQTVWDIASAVSTKVDLDPRKAVVDIDKQLIASGQETKEGVYHFGDTVELADIPELDGIGERAQIADAVSHDPATGGPVTK